MDYDSKERGFPISADNRAEGLFLGCLACRRIVCMRWADVLKTWGVGTYTRDIARSLKCSGCGARKGYIHVWVDSRQAHARDKPETSAYEIIGAIERQPRLV